MSWDVLLQRFEQNVTSPADVPDDYKPPVIGSRSDIASSLCKLFPDADGSDPVWILIDGEDLSIEVSTGDDEQCDALMLHVQGGDDAVQAVMQITQHFQTRALDCSTGEFMDAMPDPSAGFQQWRAYRDKVFGENDDG